MTFAEKGTGIVTHVKKELASPLVNYYVVIFCPDKISLSTTITRNENEPPVKAGDVVNLKMGSFFWVLDE